MHHVAIMKKSWGLIPKILSGEKTIESRWYQMRRAPWNNIHAGDTVFFKNSGELVTAKATVAHIKQFEIKQLSDATAVIDRYGKSICLVESNPERWGKLPRYCILIGLKASRKIRRPFAIDKRGFGSAAAWLMVKNIKKIRI